jgi:bifunctional DNA-binding transcriptional regulator/antitoxin component of YhaV-PrlF toxin-antitoxin module
MTQRVFESTVEYNEDFDEYYVTIPEELLELTGWEEGDILEYITQKDGSVLVKRSEEFYGEENDSDE